MFGYLDAGTGSMIASGIAALGAGIAVVFITFKNSILGVISPKRRRAAAEAKAAASETTEPVGATEAPSASDVHNA